MKTRGISAIKIWQVIGLLSVLCFALPVIAQDQMLTLKGKIIDDESGEALIFASVSLSESNVATVSNSEGKFSLNLPENSSQARIQISFLGYEDYEQALSAFSLDKSNTIRMVPSTVNLTEVKVFPNNPQILINRVLDNRLKNYPDEAQMMTAFYRETIMKRKSYIGLAEAVVEIYKMPYQVSREDQVRLLKGRKGTEVDKQDTLLFKLQGGAYSTLTLDVMKDPYILLSQEMQQYYAYSFENITRIHNDLFYVIGFKQYPQVQEPLFYGKLYIHTESMAIAQIAFSLNTANKEAASAIFIKKKPFGARVYPEQAAYLVNYRQQGDKWYFAYSRADVSFKVNWKKRLFNTSYETSSELAITNRKKATDKPFKAADRLRSTDVMTEAISGFTDEGFWGDYNVIEPEKSIQSAIKKIVKKLEKLE